MAALHKQHVRVIWGALQQRRRSRQAGRTRSHHNVVARRYRLWWAATTVEGPELVGRTRTKVEIPAHEEHHHEGGNGKKHGSRSEKKKNTPYYVGLHARLTLIAWRRRRRRRGVWHNVRTNAVLPASCLCCCLFFVVFSLRRKTLEMWETKKREREREVRRQKREVYPRHGNAGRQSTSIIFKKEKKKTYQFYIVNDQNKGTSSPTGKDCTVVGCVCMYVCVCVYSANLHYQKKKKKTLRVKKAEARHQRRCTFLYAHLQFKLDLRKRENSLIEKKKWRFFDFFAWLLKTILPISPFLFLELPVCEWEYRKAILTNTYIYIYIYDFILNVCPC